MYGTIDTHLSPRVFFTKTTPPRARACGVNRNRVNLTVEEVVKAVEAQGATDVRAIDLRGKDAGMGDFMVFSTATNPLHMRRMANMVVQAVRERSRYRERQKGREQALSHNSPLTTVELFLQATRGEKKTATSRREFTTKQLVESSVAIKVCFRS